MSKKIEASINCPNCDFQFNQTLYRSIWGEYPENKELVMNNEINMALCPSCGSKNKVHMSFIYTNAKKHFAVWWEPEYDSQIDADSQAYASMMGKDSYLASADRIKDWNEFKATIEKYENGELKRSPGVPSQKMQKDVQDFMSHLKNNNKKQKSGCLGLLAFIIVCSLIFL